MQHVANNKPYMGHIVRKPTFCIGENKGAVQLRSNCEADQHLCFRYTDSTIPLFSKIKISSLFCASTARFVSDLFKTHIVGFLMTWLTCCHKPNIDNKILPLMKSLIKGYDQSKQIIVSCMLC